MKRIGFISTRIAGTDGVSLETYKWVKVLERNGFECFFFAGQLDTPEDHSLLEPKAHFEHPEIVEINELIFGRSKRERWLTEKIHSIAKELKKKLYEFYEKFNIDLIIPENALAIPLNIPLGIAITEFIAETEIPCIAHHHDFSWERKRFLVNAVQDYIFYAFPPNLPSIRHVVINSMASRQLSYQRGVSNVIIPNVFDFANPPYEQNPKAAQLREELGFSDDDLFVLQPTRVVPRKWIERSVELVSLLNIKKRRLVISHESGDEGDIYQERVKEYAERLGVELIFIGNKIGPMRMFGARSDREYSIDDAYQAADIVSYPSGYEGFGNAFLEAVYFKKPIVVNRYSIFVEDIEPYGFDVIKFESFITKEVVNQLMDFLRPGRLIASVEKNYEIGKRYFSFEVLEKRLLHLINSFEGK
jgi:hypothetical protein